MMRALIDGVADPAELAELAKARLRTKLPQLRKALTARFRAHHAFLLTRMLAHIEALEADIEVLSERITELVEPWTGQLMILDSITGVGPRAAEVIAPRPHRIRPPAVGEGLRADTRSALSAPDEDRGFAGEAGRDPDAAVLGGPQDGLLVELPLGGRRHLVRQRGAHGLLH
jgi:hypothetical protein